MLLTICFIVNKLDLKSMSYKRESGWNVFGKGLGNKPSLIQKSEKCVQEHCSPESHFSRQIIQCHSSSLEQWSQESNFSRQIIPCHSSSLEQWSQESNFSRHIIPCHSSYLENWSRVWILQVEHNMSLLFRGGNNISKSKSTP